MQIKAKIKNFFTLPNLVWLVLFGLLFYIIRPFLTSEMLMGCDNTGHYYLTQKMLELLTHLKISGYDVNWFAGYPVFTFYTPLFYIVACLIHLISFKLIPLVLCVNILLFLSQFLFLIGVYYVSNIFFKNKRINLLSLLFGFIILLNPFNFLGIGILGSVLAGLFTNTFAWPFFLFFIGFLEKLRQTENKKYLWGAIIFLSILILTHIFTAFFSFLIAFAYLIIYFKSKNFRYQILWIICISLMLTAFWWVPFISNLNYVYYDENIYISSIVSEINPNDGHNWINQEYSFSLIALILKFLFLFFFIGLGLIASLKKEKYLPAILILIFILLAFLAGKIFIHTYRFYSEFFVISVFLCAYGSNYFIEKIYQKFKDKNLAKKTIFFLIFIALAGNFLLFNTQGLHRLLYSKNNTYILEAEQMIDYIKQNNYQRVLIDNLSMQYLLFPNRHYFSGTLASYNVPVLVGLLHESSLSKAYFYSKGYQAIFAEDNNGEYSQEIENYFKNLSFYGTKHVLVRKDIKTPLLRFLNSENNKGFLIEKKTIGPFALLEINIETQPLIAETDYQPFLFIEKQWLIGSSKSFKNFSFDWYDFGYADDYLVIRANKQLEKISNNDLSKIKGYITVFKDYTKSDNLSFPPFSQKGTQCPSNQELSYWGGLKKPVIVLNVDSNCANQSNNVYFIQPNENKELYLASIREIILKINTDKVFYSKIDPQILNNEQIKFNSTKGVLINFSYFPKWESNDKTQTIFWATPSMMFVFAKGETELSYK